jgi:hypothetical protein
MHADQDYRRHLAGCSPAALEGLGVGRAAA